MSDAPREKLHKELRFMCRCLRPDLRAELEYLITRASSHGVGEYSTDDFRNAPSGTGPLAATWADKPHRLLYDLCGEIERLRAPKAQEDPITHMLDDRKSCNPPGTLCLTTDEPATLYPSEVTCESCLDRIARLTSRDGLWAVIEMNAEYGPLNKLNACTGWLLPLDGHRHSGAVGEIVLPNLRLGGVHLTGWTLGNYHSFEVAELGPPRS